MPLSLPGPQERAGALLVSLGSGRWGSSSADAGCTQMAGLFLQTGNIAVSISFLKAFVFHWHVMSSLLLLLKPWATTIG